MDAREFLTLAEDLVVIKNARPCHFRAAIGRAYYAAFNFASETLTNMGFPPTTSGKGHVHVIQLLQRCGDDVLAGAGGMLGDLQGSRHKADYELRRADIEKLGAAQTAVEIADSIFKDIESFTSDASRKAVASSALKEQYTSITGRPVP